MTTIEDVADVYKNLDTLTLDGYVRDRYEALSMSPEGIAKIYEPAPSKGDKARALLSQKFVHLGMGIHREQLHAGKDLEDLSEVHLAHSEERQNWTKIPKNAVLRSVHKEKSVFLRYPGCGSETSESWC